MAAATASVDAAPAVIGQAQQPARRSQVIGAFSFFYAGFAGGAELWRGRGGPDIANGREQRAGG
jgi:hypothetical protein